MLKYVRNSDLVAAEMDGDIVMMSIENGRYYGLTGIAPDIWNFLETQKNIDELIDLLQPRYDVSEEVLRADVDIFLADMVNNGLVQVA